MPASSTLHCRGRSARSASQASWRCSGSRQVEPSRGRRVACAVSGEFKKAVDEFVEKNKVLVFMKGNRDFPQCGFSNTVVQILRRLEVPFETVDILTDDMLRQGMKDYSQKRAVQWPTFPQVYIDGEFYGGCDIMLEAYESGALKEELERVMLE